MKQMGLMQQNNDAQMIQQMKQLGLDPAEFGAAAHQAEKDPDLVELDKFLAKEASKSGGGANPNSEAAMLAQLQREIDGMGGAKSKQNAADRIADLKQ